MDDLGKPRGVAAIATAWLLVGVLDISSAFAIWSYRGITWTRGLQGLTLPLIGQKAFTGGIATAAFGLALHFFVAFVVVTVFYLASRKMTFLLRHACPSGVIYGLAVYLVMYWLVLPRAYPKFRHALGNDLLAMAIHVVLIGLPTALTIRRYSLGEMTKERL
jgi:hypothetical protein